MMTLVELPTAGTGEGIIKIAAGSSSIGSHSMAIDRAGTLYGWGVAYAVGVGQIKAITTPTVVPVGTVREPLYAEHARRGTARGAEAIEPQGEIEDDVEFVEDALEADGQATQASRFTAAERREVVDVACGGGFTVCVTRAGHVFSWGVWAHGRLGTRFSLKFVHNLFCLHCMVLSLCRLGTRASDRQAARTIPGHGQENCAVPAASAKVIAHYFYST
jgi:alpha-tubulin suppressor-like RCC1 family protein